MLQTSNFTRIFLPVLSELCKCYIVKNLCGKHSGVLKKGWSTRLTLSSVCTACFAEAVLAAVSVFMFAMYGSQAMYHRASKG